MIGKHFFDALAVAFEPSDVSEPRASLLLALDTPGRASLAPAAAELGGVISWNDSPGRGRMWGGYDRRQRAPGLSFHDSTHSFGYSRKEARCGIRVC